jgi:hypothetical protein
VALDWPSGLQAHAFPMLMGILDFILTMSPLAQGPAVTPCCWSPLLRACHSQPLMICSQPEHGYWMPWTKTSSLQLLNNFCKWGLEMA